MDEVIQRKLDGILEQAKTKVKGDWRTYAELKARACDLQLEPPEYDSFIQDLSDILEL